MSEPEERRYWIRWAGAEIAAGAFEVGKVLAHSFDPDHTRFRVGDVFFVVVGQQEPLAPKRLIGWQVVESAEHGRTNCRLEAKFAHRFTLDDMRTVPYWRTLSLPMWRDDGSPNNERPLERRAAISLARLIYQKGERIPEELVTAVRQANSLLVPDEPFLFFAWQHDRALDDHHRLINGALTGALARLKADAQVKDAPREDGGASLVSGAERVPGMADIPAVIQARIRECAVFVADLTFTSSTEAGKLSPNGNVLFELGCAIGRPDGWANVICVINTAYGSWDKMLFDLRHHRKPVEYFLPADAGPAKRDIQRRALEQKLLDVLRENYAAILGVQL